MTERFTDYRVPDPGMRVLFAREHRWQCWLDVEAALAVAEAECGVIPAAAGRGIESAARLAFLDVARIERGIAESSHPLMALVTAIVVLPLEIGKSLPGFGILTRNNEALAEPAEHFVGLLPRFSQPFKADEAVHHPTRAKSSSITQDH